MNTIRLLCLLVACSVLLQAAPAVAHKASDSFLRLDIVDEHLLVEWDISLRDLESAVGLDSDQDGAITWGEVRENEPAVTAYALSRLSIGTAEQACVLQPGALRVIDHSDGVYAALRFAAPCPHPITSLQIHYDLMFDLDPTHRGLVSVSNGQTTVSHVISPETSPLTIRLADDLSQTGFATFVVEGVHHILAGLDHVLFLLTLLIPTVLVRRHGQWIAVDRLRPAALAVLKVVTLFTLAHSITLWLAVTGHVSLPSRLVESVIAVSIIVMALNNIRPVLPFSGATLGFFFGLVHGFGFAGVLADLGLEGRAFTLALLGFNIGVELGQLLIVAFLMPAAFILRESVFYRRHLVYSGSVVIAVIATVWMFERLGDLRIISA